MVQNTSNNNRVTNIVQNTSNNNRITEYRAQATTIG